MTLTVTLGVRLRPVMSLFEVLYLLLFAATLCVGFWNLKALQRYVADTAAIVRTAQEQARTAQEQLKTAQDQLEAAWTPCVLPHLPVERLETDFDLAPIRAAPVHLRNAGHGPALDVRCRLESTDGGPSFGSIDTPFLPAGVSTATLSLETPPPDRRAFKWKVFHLRATYRSVTGKEYETAATVAPGEAATQYHLIYFGMERENIPLVERYTSGND